MFEHNFRGKDFVFEYLYNAYVYANLSFTVSQSPKAAGPIPVDPHDQRTPKHNHLSARSNDRGPRQQTTDRPPSPIQGPSSAAAAAAAAAKALRTGQGMIMKAPPSSSSGGKKQPRSLEGRDNLSGNNPSSDSQAPLHKNHQPLSHQPHPFAYGGYQPHAIPHSPDDNAAASAAYYAAMYGHNPYGGYYNRDMTTNWPEEAEGSERSASADSDDRGTKKAAQAAYRHFDERDRAYLQYHRQHQQQAHHYYQHHSEHHRGFFHHPGNGSGYRPPPHVAREYIPSDEHVGGEAADTEDVISTRNNESNSSKSKSSGKVVMGSASPIHVARGMSTSPLAQNNMLAAGRHVTPHHHNHNTRQSSRKKIKEEEEEEPKPSLSASSIFRGRPGPSMSSRAADDFDDDDEDSPQRILLSLSKGDSFEDRGFGSAGSGGMVQMVGGDSTVGGAVKSGDIESSSPATLANGSGSNKKSATKGRGGKKKTKNAGKAVADSSKKSSANSKKSSKSSSKGGKKKATAKGSGKTPSSPDEPPRIQHSFSQNTRRGNDPFYFDVSRSGAFLIVMCACAWYCGCCVCFVRSKTHFLSLISFNIRCTFLTIADANTKWKGCYARSSRAHDRQCSFVCPVLQYIIRFFWRSLKACHVHVRRPRYFTIIQLWPRSVQRTGDQCRRRRALRALSDAKQFSSPFIWPVALIW